MMPVGNILTERTISRHVAAQAERVLAVESNLSENNVSVANNFASHSGGVSHSDDDVEQENYLESDNSQSMYGRRRS